MKVGKKIFKVLKRINPIIQLVVLIGLFCMERYYDSYNFKLNQRLDLVKMNTKIISKCNQPIEEACTVSLKEDLYDFRSLYDVVSLLLSKDKDVLFRIAQVDNNITNILDYGVCECDLLSENLVALNYSLFRD